MLRWIGHGSWGVVVGTGSEMDPGMTTDTKTNTLEITVNSSEELVDASIRDRRPDALRLFGELTPAQREQLVHDAWCIGLQALGRAHSAAEEARLNDIGRTLKDDLDRQLRLHVDHQQETIAALLSKFFDPKDGHVMQRLAAFVDDQGVLARLLDKYLAPQNSVLAQSLAKQVGESSPLFKKLSPSDSDGLIQTLEVQLRTVIGEEHADLARALDPLAPDGAIARFLKRLREELQGESENRDKQMASALAALNANDENSLLSRMMRETQQARLAVLQAVNPDAPNSPLGTLKASLTTLLKDHIVAQQEHGRLQAERQASFEKEVRDALVRIETKRDADLRAPRGGFDFEDAVARFVAGVTHGAPCIFDATGNTTGAITRSKKGDAVLRFTDESAFAGAAVVFESKRDASYTVTRALAELDEARRNRTAMAGVFVMAASHSADTFPLFSRHGNNVLVVWDDGDASTDVRLQAAILLGMALVTRTKSPADEGDIKALADVEARITAELERLESMRKHTAGIRRHANDLDEDIGKAAKALDLLLRKAKSTLRALNVELQDEAIERTSPIALPSDALFHATAALGAGEAAE